ncbi:MAG TPA: PilZ domain-containing protein [Terriglobales bacterium]|nr:PilZ domain-containing protein [Terriglobales bacterium]
MTTKFATSLAPIPIVPRKNTARIALFDLPEASTVLLTECFRQFGIDTIPISSVHKERLHREKFDACALPMKESVGGTIELARNSASNSRIVIYGVGGTAQDAMRFSKYCINAIFHEPLERSAVVKLIRSTRPLVLHEFRRYVRVPVMTDVAVVAADGSRLSVTSQDISTGGMSLKGTAHLEPGQLVEVSFALLTLPRIHVRGYVTWKKPNKTVGVRFDISDERRRRLKDWIGGYLEA